MAVILFNYVLYTQPERAASPKCLYDPI